MMSPAFDQLQGRATPLLRWGPALLKLELLGPPRRLVTQPGVLEARGNAALAAAAGVRGLTIVPRGPFTHEVRKGLELWGARLDPSARPTLASTDSDEAALLFQRTLGEELRQQLSEPPPLLVAPAGERAALLGALLALRTRWPSVRGLALAASDEELPDLPAEVDSAFERVAVSRAQARVARARLARELGLLAGHASAAAAVYAFEHGGLALVSTPGEREFSLE